MQCYTGAVAEAGERGGEGEEEAGGAEEETLSRWRGGGAVNSASGGLNRAHCSYTDISIY